MSLVNHHPLSMPPLTFCVLYFDIHHLLSLLLTDIRNPRMLKERLMPCNTAFLDRQLATLEERIDKM